MRFWPALHQPRSPLLSYSATQLHSSSSSRAYTPLLPHTALPTHPPLQMALPYLVVSRAPVSCVLLLTFRKLTAFAVTLPLRYHRSGTCYVCMVPMAEAQVCSRTHLGTRSHSSFPHAALSPVLCLQPFPRATSARPVSSTTRCSPSTSPRTSATRVPLPQCDFSSMIPAVNDSTIWD